MLGRRWPGAADPTLVRLTEASDVLPATVNLRVTK
jgi:hypothetical protein